jgi:hypothetical protein
MKRASILFLVFGLLIVAVTPAFAQSFTLIGPNGNRLIRDADSDLVAFVWQPVAGATDYDLSLFKVSTNPRAAIGTVFTVNVPTASCNATECFYTPTGPQYATMDTGEYAWTVVADLPSSDIEASNGPLYFSVNTAAIGFLGNPNFETGTLAPWAGVNLSGDKLRTDKGVGGSWGFQFNGSATENSKLTQQKNVTYYGIDGNDQLGFTAEYRAPKSNVNLQFVATIVYTAGSGLPKDKVKLTAVANAAYTLASSPFTPDGPVKKVKVDIIHKSPSGKAWVDNVQVTLAGAP